MSASRSVNINLISNLFNNFRDKSDRVERHDILYTNSFHAPG